MLVNSKFLKKYIFKNIRKLLFAFFVLIVLALLSIIPGLLIKNIFDIGIVNSDTNYVKKLCLYLLIIYIAKSFLNYLSNFIFTTVSQGIIYDIRKDISTKVLKLPMEFFNFKESGYINSRMSEINNISALFSVNTFKTILTLFEFFAAFYVLYNINSSLTFYMCLLMPIYYIISKKFMKSISIITDKSVEKSALVQSKIQQSLQGIEEIKNLSLEEAETTKINTATKELTNINVKQSILYSIGMELLVLCGLLSTVLLTYAGVLNVISGALTIGSYMTFLNYAPKLYAPAQSISVMLLSIQPALVSIKRLNIFIDELSEDELDKNKIEIDDINSIQFENVWFKYKSTSNYVVNDFNLTINNKSKVLIQGKNGTGKTTIFRIIMGLYEPTKGNIYINNIDSIQISKKSLRNKIGIVSQKIYLFNDTIEHNITYGIQCVDNERYLHTLKITGLNDIINSLPLKENTLVGENGSNLSGGQIQRIAIARALLKNSKVYLFDEATSHLDKETIPLINDLIKSELKNSICIFIDHKDDFKNLCDTQIYL